MVLILFPITGFQNQMPGEVTQGQPISSLHLFSFLVLSLNVMAVAVVVVRRFVNQRTGLKYQQLQDY